MGDESCRHEMAHCHEVLSYRRASAAQVCVWARSSLLLSVEGRGGKSGGEGGVISPGIERSMNVRTNRIRNSLKTVGPTLGNLSSECWGG